MVVAKTELKRNQFGGNIGGPIWRSKKLYGFFGYEGFRQGSPNNRITTVPTPLERSGDFSQTFNANGTPAIIYDPLTTRPDPNRPGRFIRDPFPGNRIPTDRMDTVGLNVLKLLPVPNQPGEGAAKINNFVNNGTIQTNNDRYDIRIDWARSDKHTLFGRFTKSPQTSLRPSLYNGNDNAETDWQDYNPRWHLSIGNTFTLSPTLVVNVLLGGGNWVEKQISKGLGYDFTTELGLPATIAQQFDVNTPFRFNLADYATLGVTRHLVAARNIRNGQINVSKELGAHSLQGRLVIGVLTAEFHRRQFWYFQLRPLLYLWSGPGLADSNRRQQHRFTVARYRSEWKLTHRSPPGNDSGLLGLVRSGRLESKSAADCELWVEVRNSEGTDGAVRPAQLV